GGRLDGSGQTAASQRARAERPGGPGGADGRPGGRRGAAGAGISTGGGRVRRHRECGRSADQHAGPAALPGRGGDRGRRPHRPERTELDRPVDGVRIVPVSGGVLPVAAGARRVPGCTGDACVSPLRGEQRLAEAQGRGQAAGAHADRAELSSSTARAAAGQSSEQANVGSATASANVSADKTAGTVLSEASSDTELLSAGPLRIGRILAGAKASHSSSGGLKRSSGLNLFDVTVNGATVGFSDKGFSTGSSASPLPANPIGEQLAKSGITVTYLAAKEVPDGVLSPGLRIEINDTQSGLHSVMVVGQALAIASGDAAAGSGLLGGGLLGSGTFGSFAGSPATSA
ncbi:MAG: hypothetical protein ACREQ5_38520, partial [Candidatus Dormibacteria bacterium]